MNITVDIRKTLAALACAALGFSALGLRAETAWTTQKHERTDACHLPHQVGLVDIYIPLFPQS